ncbi:HCP-like protein [Massarina eburnea CBS 473.64]|uniref:HCP-like protein n=1 Tax=Massarina eburnea CBS 473.64 TaxID=1395130 RepID=A0A6A6RHG6_9PLEO|nr:HCP-like protein [Massarina eburnea CBS 473.64]
MTLKDILKKKEKIKEEGATSQGPVLPPDVPAFSFFRTTTTTQEEIEPPSFPGDPTRQSALFLSPAPRGLTGRFRRHSNVSSASRAPPGAEQHKQENRLSQRMHFGRSRSSSSANIPENLPEITGDGVARSEEEEAKWERRATILVTSNSALKSGPPTPNTDVATPLSPMSPTTVSTAPDDGANLAADLEASTKMFSRLADPHTHNNALSQVLYGLALRHGWGCEPNQEQAVRYLSLAASNSAEVEKLALGAGMKKGGAAKGELVLAMFELGNCFRHGWGLKKDPAAAKHYYETAANLGDTDAMNEVAWCYLEGFGTKKDKFKAAQFLRLAESKGHKTLGNTW